MRLPDLTEDANCGPHERWPGLVWVRSTRVAFSHEWMVENFDPAIDHQPGTGAGESNCLVRIADIRTGIGAIVPCRAGESRPPGMSTTSAFVTRRLFTGYASFFM